MRGRSVGELHRSGLYGSACRSAVRVYLSRKVAHVAAGGSDYFVLGESVDARDKNLTPKPGLRLNKGVVSAMECGGLDTALDGAARRTAIPVRVMARRAATKPSRTKSRSSMRLRATQQPPLTSRPTHPADCARRAQASALHGYKFAWHEPRGRSRYGEPHAVSINGACDRAGFLEKWDRHWCWRCLRPEPLFRKISLPRASASST